MRDVIRSIPWTGVARYKTILLTGRDLVVAAVWALSTHAGWATRQLVRLIGDGVFLSLARISAAGTVRLSWLLAALWGRKVLQRGDGW